MYVLAAGVYTERAHVASLRKRFEQNQQDISYTIMALLPTLGKHVLEGMDVEGVTAELQSMSKPSRSPKPASPPETSLASSVELTSPVVADELSENGSVSIISSVHENGTSMHTPDSSMSWVDQLSMQSSQEPGAIAAAASTSESPAGVESLKLNGSLSESMLSTSSTSSKLENGHGNVSTHADFSHNVEATSMLDFSVTAREYILGNNEHNNEKQGRVMERSQNTQ